MLSKILYAEIYLICIAVVGMLLYWTVKRSNRSVSERWMIAQFAFFMISFAANLLVALANIFLENSAVLVYTLKALKSLYFITMALGVACWCGYGEAEVRNEKSKKRLPMWVITLPSFIPVGMVVLNLFTQNLFFIDPLDGSYHRRQMFHVYMLFLFVMTFVVCVRLLIAADKQMDPVKKNHLRITSIFPLCILAAWMGCFAGESVPVICVSIMFALLGTFMAANGLQVSVDKLTQVNNRQNLISFLNYRIINHTEKVFLLMIDVDYFKKINDTYGHLEGDRALVFVASTLKKACVNLKKRPYIARYGGDEFTIVLEGNRHEAAELVNNIRTLLKQDKPEDTAYEITLSIGVTEYESGMTAKDLIASADEKMYAIKETRR